MRNVRLPATGMSEHRGGSDLVSVVECVVRDCSSGKWRTVSGYPALSGGSLGAVGPHRYLLPKARESTGSAGQPRPACMSARWRCGLLCRPAG